MEEARKTWKKIDSYLLGKPATVYTNDSGYTFGKVDGKWVMVDFDDKVIHTGKSAADMKRYYDSWLTEDVQETTSTAGVYTGPVVKKKEKEVYRRFTVPTETFNKFQTGRNKFERWSKYLDLSQESQKAIYDYAKKNPKGIVVLQDETTGALRAIRRKSANNL